MLEQFSLYRKAKGGKWFLCELPGYDCGGIFVWRREPLPHERIVSIENWVNLED